MNIVEYLGLSITGISFGLFLGSLVKHFTDLRKYIHRLFDEYKKEELLDNLTNLDKSLENTAKLIFFSGFFIAIGVFIFYIGILNS